MPTISNINLSIVKDVANADITLDYDIGFNEFEKLTNVEFDETWKLVGDDTGQDGDNSPSGDDPISLGILFVSTVKSNGQNSVHRTKTRSIAFSNLNEDNGTPSTNDDEIRAVVTLTPRLPALTSRESNLVTVDA